jgi:hypothetical protein
LIANHHHYDAEISRQRIERSERVSFLIKLSQTPNVTITSYMPQHEQGALLATEQSKREQPWDPATDQNVNL